MLQGREKIRIIREPSEALLQRLDRFRGAAQLVQDSGEVDGGGRLRWLSTHGLAQEGEALLGSPLDDQQVTELEPGRVVIGFQFQRLGVGAAGELEPALLGVDQTDLGPDLG